MATYQFGIWLQTLRKQLGLSRQAVAERAEHQISQQYIHFIELGKATNIGSDKLQALAKGLNIPIQVLQEAHFLDKEPSIPLVGRAAAGIEAHAQEEEYGVESIDYLSPNQTLYAVEIMGDSMAPKLEHGDLAMIQPVKINRKNPGDLLSGRIYLLEQGSKTTCKYMVESLEQPDEYWICAENEALFSPVLWSDSRFKIAGLVVEVRKTSTLCRPVLNNI